MPTQTPTTLSPETCQRMEQALNERVASGNIQLPLLPRVATQVLALVNDPNSDAAKFASLIHQDQALAAHVLRIANSPAYMPRVPIVSLQHAVSMLGINLLSEIAFTVSLKAGTFQAPGFEKTLEGMWWHAVASGAYAKEVAKLKRANLESAYICGLLHAIGKPVVLNTSIKLAKELNIPADPAFITQLVEDHHVQFGALMGDKWALPAQVREAIAHYLDYDQAPNFKQEVMTATVAHRFATFILGQDEMSVEVLYDHPAYADLNLYPKDLAALVAAQDMVKTVVNSLSL
ncbi:MAG: HDOD domain-containing protein [Nitrospiraceae bacterium]